MLFRSGLCLLATFFVLLLDQVTKSLMLAAANPVLSLKHAWVSLKLTPSINEYFAFSIPAPTFVISIVIALVFLAVFVVWVRDLLQGDAGAIWLSLVLGGGLGNIFDRLSHGGVVDWVELSFFSLSWSSFNLADIAIIAGVCGWLWGNYRQRPALGSPHIN